MLLRPSTSPFLLSAEIELTGDPGDFLLVSLITAFVLYLLTNRLLLAPSSQSAIDNRVEFTYAFDVAVNSFFPAFLSIYVALLPLAAVVVRSNWVCLFFGKYVSSTKNEGKAG